MKKKFGVNTYIVIINVIIFLLCTFTGGLLYNIGTMMAPLVVEYGQYYRMLTAMFLHGSVDHLVSNMLILYFLGDLVEHQIGHVKYAILYFLAGIGGGCLSIYWAYATQNFVGSIGASGAVFGIIGALLWIVIRNHGYLSEMNITLGKVIFLIIYSVYQGLVGSNIDNLAHIGGLLSGMLLAFLLYRRKAHL